MPNDNEIPVLGRYGGNKPGQKQPLSEDDIWQNSLPAGAFEATAAVQAAVRESFNDRPNSASPRGIGVPLGADPYRSGFVGDSLPPGVSRNRFPPGTRPTQSVPEMRQWMNEQTVGGGACGTGGLSQEEHARQGHSSPEFVRVFNALPGAEKERIAAKPPGGMKDELTDMVRRIYAGRGRNYDQEQRDAFRAQTVGGGEDPGSAAYQRQAVFMGAEARRKQRPFTGAEIRQTERSLEDFLANVKPTASGCPRCGYPETKDGGHYKGVYLKGQPCGLCGFLESGASGSWVSPLAAFQAKYLKEKDAAEQDGLLAARLPPQSALSALDVIKLRTDYSEHIMTTTGHDVRDLLAIWRLLATIDSLMAEKETV